MQETSRFHSSVTTVSTAQTPQNTAAAAPMSTSGTPSTIGASMDSVTMEVVPRLVPVKNFMTLAAEQVRQPVDGLQEVLQSEVSRVPSQNHMFRGGSECLEVLC